jgi:esterase/lipase
MLREQMAAMDIGLPLDYLVWCGNIVNRLQLGFGYKDADVTRRIADTNVPVLVIHSNADDLTPYFMSVGIYNAIISDKKEIFSVEDSAHAEIWQDYPQEYAATVDAFLQEYL